MPDRNYSPVAVVGWGSWRQRAVPFEGFRQTVVAETYYMADGSVKEMPMHNAPRQILGTYNAKRGGIDWDEEPCK